MSTDPGASRSAKHLDAGHLDAGHLDEDAEALEDPVHAGDAQHQRDLHQKEQHTRADQPPG